MDFLVQLAEIAGAVIGTVIIIRKEIRDTEKHKWEREDRANREL